MTRLVQRLGLTRYEADEHYKRALQLYQKGELNDAILEVGYAIELLPTNPEYYATRGFFYLEDGIEREASEDFDESLRLYPYEMLAHYGLGIIAWRDKNWSEAQEHFTAAYRADPERPETLYYLALAHHRNQENDRASAYMQKAAERFDAQGDGKNRRNADRWIKEFEKLLKQLRDANPQSGQNAT
jgi:tetratricopeptide (TPR) repeat protein